MSGRGPDYKQEKTLQIAELKISDPGGWRTGDSWREVT